MLRRLVFLTIITLAVSFLVIIIGLTWHSISAQSKGRTPFTALKVTKLYDPNGIHRDTEIYLYAVRSDGSNVLVKQMAGNQLQGTKTITDVILKRKITVDPLTESTTTYPIRSDDYLLRFTRRPARCTDDPNPERGTILGYEVVKVTRRIEDANIVTIEEWVAPALDCYPLRSVTSLRAKDGTPGPRNEHEVVVVIPGEPEASLFEVPSNYTERSPSQVMSEWARRRGVQAVSPAASALDEAYYRRRR